MLSVQIEKKSEKLMGKLIEIGYKDIDIKEKLAKRILSAGQTCCSTQKF